MTIKPEKIQNPSATNLLGNTLNEVNMNNDLTLLRLDSLELSMKDTQMYMGGIHNTMVQLFYILHHQGSFPLDTAIDWFNSRVKQMNDFGKPEAASFEYAMARSLSDLKDRLDRKDNPPLWLVPPPNKDD